jgi:type IV pilus assembly protein PilC
MPFITPDKKINPENFNISAPEKKSFSQKLTEFFSNLQRIPVKEKLIFIQNLSVMIKASIPVLVAFRTLSEQTENKQLSRVLKQIALKLEQGSSLTESMRPYPKVFNELFINMINSGEVSGKLEEVLHHLHLQTKKQYALTSRVKGALTYPLIIVTVMIGIGIFMMIFVIPKITSVFTEYEVTLPLATRILIGTSYFLANQWLISLLSAIAIIYLFIRIIRTRKGKYFFQAIALRAPIFGPIIKKINLANFARTTSSLLKTDIMIVNAFQITANTLGNLHYREAVMDISEKIKKGGQINEVIKNYPDFFPPMVTQMIAIGEQTGEITDILEDLAVFYEEEVDQIMQNLPSIIEPLLILLLGVGVGGIAIAIIMPMYSLTSSV